MSSKLEDIRLFAISGSEKIGQSIAKNLKVNLSTYKKTTFSDGEMMVQSNVSVRSKDIYVIASTYSPVNDRLMELLIFIDMLKRASSHKINIIMPYYGYCRQDRKAEGRQPITAKLVANLLTHAGANSLMSIDLHNPSIQGFFDFPVDDLKGAYILAPNIKNEGKYTIVSPDHGGAVRARILADLVSNTIKIAIVDKRRTGPNTSEISGILGNIKNKNIVIFDDMIDTGSTIIKAAEKLKEYGAKKIMVAASHGIFSKGFDAFDNCNAINKIVILDTIESVYKIKSKKLKIIPVGPILAKIIKLSILGKSITGFYNSTRNKLN